jgi:hypothetical protein
MSSNRTAKKDAQPSSADKAGHAKKPYKKPAVRAYGNIRSITQGSAHHRLTKDNAPGSLKTGV